LTRWTVVLGEVAVTVLFLVAAVASWNNGLVTTSFAPSGDMPGFDGTRYVGPWLLLAAFLVTVAGVIAIDMVARTVRAATARPPS
jgi:hypothetical protein